MSDLTDIEICKACARATTLRHFIGPDDAVYLFGEGEPDSLSVEKRIENGGPWYLYSPLANKDQAMDLVIALHMLIMPGTRTPAARMPWHVEATDSFEAWDTDLLRAICLCAARTQLAKEARR